MIINNQINKVNDFCNLNDYELVDVLKEIGRLSKKSTTDKRTKYF